MKFNTSGSLRRVLRRALAFFCALVLTFYATSMHASAQGSGNGGTLQPGAPEDGGAEELVLAVSYPPYVLSNGLLAAQVGDEYYLPFLEMAQDIFEFYVDPDHSGGVYRGYFKDEKASFGIDLSKNEMERQGKVSPLPQGAILKDPFGDGGDDIYVRLDVLNEIWPVDMTVNMSTLSMLVKTEEKLAFEIKLERDQNRVLAMARKTYAPSANIPQLPFKDNPYKLIGRPAVDIDTEYNWDTEKKKFTGRQTFSGLQDLAWASADYGGTFTYEEGRLRKPDTIRLRLTRDAFGDKTLPLGFKEAQGGDVNIQHRSLITNSSNGRGVSVTTYPSYRTPEFDRITVDGTGVPGWEVELYRNDILETFGTVDEKGEYRFEDVPLTVGNNQIRVVLYGPQGQVQERIENHQVSGGMQKPGQTDYAVGMVDADRPFILLGGNNSTKPRGMAGSAYVAHGLNERVTVFGSVSELPTVEEKKSYATAGVMGSFLNSLGQAELFKQSRGGHALDLRFATELLGIRLNLQSAFFRGFESPDAGYGQNAKTYEGELRANKNVKTFLGGLGLQLAVKHRENKTGLPFSTVNFQQSFGLSGLHLSNSINAAFTDFRKENSTGKIDATVRLKNWQFRSAFDYNMYPRREISSVNGEVRYTDRDGFSAAVNAQHNFLTLDRSAGVQLGYDFGKVLGSFDMNWVKEGGYSFSLRASTSLGPHGPNGKYVASSKKISRDAPVQGHVFLDNDGDKVFSEGDEPVPEAQLLIDRSSGSATGDENGYVIARGGTPNSVASVEVNKSGLIDPYYQPALPGYSTVLRPGSMPMFEFPVIETGAIDGTVYRANGSPISGMKLQLINESGEVVMTSETAYDGYYTFEFVPPGTYTVRADPSYKINVPPETVTVASEDLFAYGIDLQLLEQAEDAEAADEGGTGDEPVSPDDAVAESGGVAHTHHERSNGTLQPAPLSSEGDLSALVKRVRIGEYPDKVRLVLDLSGPIVYSMSFADGGKTLTVDLPGTAWDAARNWKGARTPVIESFEAQALPEGGTRLVIRGRGAIASGLNGILNPADGLGHRLFIDIHGN